MIPNQILIYQTKASTLTTSILIQAVGLLYKEICGDHGRVLWFRDTTDAKKIGITESSLICEPFKVLLSYLVTAVQEVSVDFYQSFSFFILVALLLTVQLLATIHYRQ